MSESFLLMKLSDNDNYIVGKLVSETDGEIIVEYPIAIRLSPNPVGTTSVSTTKFMPFSMSNKVAIMKNKIVAMSMPNHKIIGYYQSFMEKYSKVYDSVLEDDILGIRPEQAEAVMNDEVAEGSDDNVLTFKVPSSNTVH